MKSPGLIVGTVIVAIAVGGVALVQAGYNSKSTEPAASTPSAENVGSWPVPADQRTRAEAAQLDMGPMGTADHYHPQLSITVDGKPVQVPAGIGIDAATGQMSAVHTHTADGVVHIEAATTGQKFTLGQLFTQWGVEVEQTSLGNMRDGRLTVIANGVSYTKDPGTLPLAADQEIAVSFTSREAMNGSAAASGSAR